MDVFLEQIVSKKNTGTDTLKRVGILVAVVIVIYAALFILPMFAPMFASIGFLVAAGAVYGGWFLISSLKIEYEYILTNGEIDIDKIIARRKRKRLITVNTRNFAEFGLYRPEEHAGKQYSSTIMACSSTSDPNTYYAVMDHEKFGRCMLIFNPNDKIIENAKQYVKRNAMR